MCHDVQNHGKSDSSRRQFSTDDDLRFLPLTDYGLSRRVPPNEFAKGANSNRPAGRNALMSRPKQNHPTPAELEVLHVLWERGGLSVRDVMEALNHDRPRAYTSVMSLLNVMTDKGLLVRKPDGRAFVYAAKAGRKRTMSRMVADLLGRAFDGSAHLMVAHILEEADPNGAELEEIRHTIAAYEQQRRGDR